MLLAVGMLCGCATQKMSGDQLARVAKDWSLSIRASQVIPVYPLTEDLQPGDVFLVQTPVEDQVKVYLAKGFLPLENLVTRLSPAGYARFYRGWPHVADGDKAPPRPWQFPKDESPDSDFSRAPLAAFPTYNFSVSRSGGLNVAIPVQSVPVGLNLLDSASANGTITLKDAFTYALPARTMFDAIHQWCRDNADYLSQYEPAESTTDGKHAANKFYLRVINRVYLVKTVDVSLFSNRGFGVGGSAGVPQPVQLLNIANATEAAKQFAAVNDILSDATSPAPRDAGAPAGAGAPQPPAVGGTVKLAMATSRSVSLVETFRRPLVIGYLASDYAIGANGKCAAPVPTLSLLEGHSPAAGKTIEYLGCDENCARIRPWIKQGTNQQKLETWLEKKGGEIAIADFLTGDYAGLRQLMVVELIEAIQ
ncbi:MAG TPA: hypothetical protein VGR01_13710 [Burkholderiales bacterium]|nr:hypothetical protein [Burkholderiales bacterium]